jgi:GAF domain-containing protein
MNDSNLRRTRETALEMQSRGDSLCEILSYLVEEAESVSHGEAVCSVLLLDEEGLLRNGASPGLPDEYLAAIDRLKPDPTVGTCAAAAATGKIVITPDLTSDAGWRELKHLPVALGLAAAWSVPLVTAEGRVLGTFGTYFRQPRAPRPEERSFVEKLAQIATQIVENAQSRVATA